jgi:hypothetical protein
MAWWFRNVLPCQLALGGFTDEGNPFGHHYSRILPYLEYLQQLASTFGHTPSISAPAMHREVWRFQSLLEAFSVTSLSKV